MSDGDIVIELECTLKVDFFAMCLLACFLVIKYTQSFSHQKYFKFY